MSGRLIFLAFAAASAFAQGVEPDWARSGPSASGGDLVRFQNWLTPASVSQASQGIGPGTSAAMQAAAASLNGTVSHRELAGMSDDDGVTLRQSTAAGTISAEVLQHPMSGRAAKMISHAMNQAHRGDHLKAITELQLALKERSAVPYAHSLLGSEYLKTNQVPAALEQLTEAVKLLPRDPANHANLGYALFLMGQLEAGEAQVLTALAEDQHNAQTRSLLQQMRRIRGESGVGEASVK